MRNVSLIVATTIAVLGASALVRPAAAQPSSVAEQLFRDGKKLMAEGKVNEACTAFEGSYRKEAAVSTLLNLADCREKNGQLASAWGHFIDVERATRGKADQATLFNVAHDRGAKLEGRLSYLIINVPDAARVDGLEISRNGAPIDPAEWNRDIPVDGGEYKIEGKAPAYEAWSTTVTVGKERDKQSVNVPKFNELPQKLVPDEVVDGKRIVVDPVDQPSSFTGKRKAAAGVGAAGVVALAVGTVFYVQASGDYDDAKKAPTNEARKTLTDDANSKYLLAQIGWGVGAAAVGTAAFLWFTGGPAAAAESGVSFAPQVSSTTAGFVLGGRF